MPYLRFLENTVHTIDDIVSNNMTANNITAAAMAATTAGDSNDYNDLDYDVKSTVIICASWVIFMLYCCCQPRSGRSTEQGDRIRRIARERWLQEQNQNNRQGQDPEKRSEVMKLCMRTKVSNTCCLKRIESQAQRS